MDKGIVVFGGFILVVLLSYYCVRAIASVLKWELKPKQKKKAIDYSYKQKQSIMTNAEKEFFYRLEKICANKYYVFPQIHLSSILNEKIKGQNWRTAFSYINNWSVDYVLCDKNTLKTSWVIELDDPTHNNPDRAERDKQKDEILRLAGVPIVRFSNVNQLSDKDIINKFLENK